MAPPKIPPPFGYFGSKNRLALQLCKDLPPHNCWVEAFCGSAAMTLAKEPAPIEVINDIDKEIINLFRQLRNNYIDLLRVIKLTPYAAQELYDARIKVNSETELERARKFIIQSMMAINGSFGKEKGGFSISHSYSRNNAEARVNRWNNLPKRLDRVVERLKRVRIENKDALKLLENYINRPATLIYLDPPYFADRTYGYSNDANNEEFHKRLLSLANEAICMIFISGYESDLYNSLLTEEKGWEKKMLLANTKGSNGIIQPRIEIVWMNQHYRNAIIANRVPIELTEKEQQMGKVNPER